MDKWVDRLMDRQIDEWTISVIYVPSNMKLTGVE